MKELSRANLEIQTIFPQVHDFPTPADTNRDLAVLVRLFTVADYPPLSHCFVHMAIWSMRSHLLNSDMCTYNPSIVFHIEDELFDTAKPIFEAAGIPEQCIIVFPSDLCRTNLPRNAFHKAASPFLDETLERFERVIVFDADSFSVANENSGLVPLMDVSLNHLAPDQIVLLRGWTDWNPTRDEYDNWYDHGGVGKQGWIETAAKYCGTTPKHIEGIMYPENPKLTPRPFHNGAYINLPTGVLRYNPEFRDFIREVSGTMGNEEIALAVWAMKHYVETGNRFPTEVLQDYVFDSKVFTLEWDLDAAWTKCNAGSPSLVHLYLFTHIQEYVTDWARAIHASREESNELTHNLNEALKSVER